MASYSYNEYDDYYYTELGAEEIYDEMIGELEEQERIFGCAWVHPSSVSKD